MVTSLPSHAISLNIQLINEVAKQFHYCPSSFRLTWESMVGQEVDLTDAGHGEKTSSEMGFYHGRKNTVCVKDKDGLQPRRMVRFTYIRSAS